MKSLLLIVTLVVSSVSISWKPATFNDPHYFILAVSGSVNGTAYVSNPIYYKGYADCGRLSSSEFASQAKRAFSDHLKARYSDAFPYGASNDIQILDTKQYSTSQLQKTLNDSGERKNGWMGDQKGRGYAVIETRFSYSCQ